MLRLLLCLLTVALLVWTVGCSDHSVDSKSTTDLASQFGGFTASPEAPAFNDPALAAFAADEHNFSDPIAASALFDSLASDPEAGFYHLRIIWGRLQLDSTVTTVTDWTGSLVISRGGLVLRRVIRFEPDTDSILPRTDISKIEWASVTRVHNDGIAVDLVVPPATPIVDTTVTYVVDTLGDSTEILVVDTTEPAPVTVEFSTSPYSRTFTLAELTKLDTIVYLEDSNAVAFNAFRLERIPCPRGFITGFWGYDSTGQGIFKGTWISKQWVAEGNISGHFEKDSTGRGVFFGKWIDETGNFEGLLRGRWELHPNFHADSTSFTRAGGWFRGGIFDADANPVGVIGGHFMSAEGKHPGFMQGRWKVGCPDIAGGGDDGMDDNEDMGMEGFGDGSRGGMGGHGGMDGYGGMH